MDVCVSSSARVTPVTALAVLVSVNASLSAVASLTPTSAFSTWSLSGRVSIAESYGLIGDCTQLLIHFDTEFNANVNKAVRDRFTVYCITVLENVISTTVYRVFV